MLRFTFVVMVLLLPLRAMAEDAFPVEITHKYGSTVIDHKPERIVSLSFIGHDFLLALGVVPYALRRWYGTDPYGVWPWGHDALGDAEPVVMFGLIDIERVALLNPDLIVGQWSGMTERDYALLSQIAPTIPPQPDVGDYGMSWQDMLRVLGRATGTSAKASQIITRIENRFADIRDAHPDWTDQTAVMVWAGQTGAYTKDDIRGKFLKQLGLRVPDAVNERGSLNLTYTLIPDEDLTPIDADVLIWLDAGGTIGQVHHMPLRPTMRAYGEGREVYADPLLSSALSHSSPLSLDYALDRIVPLLEQALDGDPATPVQSSKEIGLLPEGS